MKGIHSREAEILLCVLHLPDRAMRLGHVLLQRLQLRVQLLLRLLLLRLVLINLGAHLRNYFRINDKTT